MKKDLNFIFENVSIEAKKREIEKTINPPISHIINTFFNDTKMVKTYPNLKVQQVDGSMVYFKDLLPNIKPYFFKFSDQDFYK